MGPCSHYSLQITIFRTSHTSHFSLHFSWNLLTLLTFYYIFQAGNRALAKNIVGKILFEICTKFGSKLIRAKIIIHYKFSLHKCKNSFRIKTWGLLLFFSLIFWIWTQHQHQCEWVRNSNKICPWFEHMWPTDIDELNQACLSGCSNI